MGQGVGGFQCWDDFFVQVQCFEGFKGFIIGNRYVISVFSAVKICVLWVDRWEIQFGGDGVRFFNLFVFGLYYWCFYIEIDIYVIMFQWCVVFVSFDIVIIWFYINQVDVGFIDEISKYVDGI